MRHQIVVTVVSALVLTCASAGPTPIVRPRANRARQESPSPQSTACGDIIEDVNNGFAYFYATDAYDCLTSVPFNPAVATRFINYVNTTLQFQSTLELLKNPPVGYQQPAVDVASQLTSIQNNVTAGVYKNQYQFEIDLQHLLYSTHDAHLHLTAGITAAFNFLAPFSITAASSDGKSLPKVYITEQLRNQSATFTPSPIKTINNQTAAEYLSKVASLNAFGGLEAHADWNQLFAMPALDITGSQSIWDGYIGFFPGDEIITVLEDGTNYTDYWLALYNEPYATGPLTTGGDFYNYFVLGLLPESFNASAGFYNAAYAFTDEPASNDTSPPPENSWKDYTGGAYPDPDVAQEGLAVADDGVVSGYFLQDVDAAVLSIPTFGQSGLSIGNFSSAISYFIGNVTEANITRVVIDLQQNTGGLIELAFSTFGRFFPDNDPFAGSRRRNHQLGNTLGEAYTAFFDTIETTEPQYNDFVADEWVITPRLNAATGQNFSSWAEYYGPIEQGEDSFTLTERYNLSSYVFDSAFFEGWIPRGYTEEEPFDEGYTQPFDANNIVLLTDAACSSTCALLVEMFTQVGVKTIVAGGAPVTGPMQAVGGTRGAMLYHADTLDAELLQLSSIDVNNTTSAVVPELNEDGYRDSGVFTTVLGINLRDQIRANESEPLQFKYEAADCRIFYTVDNVYNMSRLWRDVVAASFDDPSLCVEGSTGFRNSSKPAPEPPKIQSVAPDLDLDAPDAILIAPDLDLSGGPTAITKGSKSGGIKPCTQGCGTNSDCRKVWLSSCKAPYTQIPVERCLPITTGQDFCPAGTSWSWEQKHIPKQAPGGSKVGSFSKQQVVYTGPCTPIAESLANCVNRA